MKQILGQQYVVKHYHKPKKKLKKKETVFVPKIEAQFFKQKLKQFINGAVQLKQQSVRFLIQQSKVDSARRQKCVWMELFCAPGNKQATSSSNISFAACLRKWEIIPSTGQEMDLTLSVCAKGIAWPYDACTQRCM